MRYDYEEKRSTRIWPVIGVMVVIVAALIVLAFAARAEQAGTLVDQLTNLLSRKGGAVAARLVKQAESGDEHAKAVIKDLLSWGEQVDTVITRQPLKPADRASILKDDPGAKFDLSTLEVDIADPKAEIDLEPKADGGEAVGP